MLWSERDIGKVSLAAATRVQDFRVNQLVYLDVQAHPVEMLT